MSADTTDSTGKFTNIERPANTGKTKVSRLTLAAGTIVCVLIGIVCSALLLGPVPDVRRSLPVESPRAAGLIVERINASRTAADLPPLIIDDEFSRGATDYNQWLLDTLPQRVGRGEPALQSSVESNATLVFKNNRQRPWSHIGESVGRADSAIGVHDAFMGSEGHVDHILDPSFTHVGVGVHVVDGTTYATAHFAAIG